MTPQPPRTVDLFVSGRWQPPRAGQYEPATSPVTGELIGHVAQGDRADAGAAVQAAAAALGGWAAATAFERARALHRVADACQRRRDELARALTLDQGKPLHAEAYPEVDDLIGYWRDAAEDVLRLDGAIPPSRLPGARVLIERRPLGVVAVITPWNWPYTMPAQVIAPALAAGQHGRVGARAEHVGVQRGARGRHRRRGPAAGDGRLPARARARSSATRSPAIRASPPSRSSGSTQTGLSVARRAAGKAQLLEMGNNGPLVVMDDADLDRAVAGTLVGAYLCSGQSCTAAERILVHERVHDAFVAALAAAVGKEVVLGDPFDPRTTMGPLNNADVAAKTARHVADALARGADLITGGGAEPGRPTALYWQPTVLDNVPRDAVVAREETFGPVAPVIAVASLEDAITLTDDLPYGLMASIYTADAGTGLRYADSVRAAWVNVNESSNYWETHLPFGGGGGSASGVGRVGGRYAMEALTQVRTVVLSGLA